MRKKALKLWSRARVVWTIKWRYQHGQRLNSAYVQKKCGHLYRSALKYFPSWAKAIEAIGIDYESISIHRFHIDWTKQRIVADILSLRKNSEAINAGAVSINHGQLYQAACRLFGSWKKAVVATSIDYSTILQKDFSWTKTKVINGLRSRLERGLDLSKSVFIIEDKDLYHAAIRIFGNRKNALSAAGIDPDRFDKRRTWTKKQVIDEIHKLSDNAEALNFGHVYSNHCALWSAAENKFGSWNKALIAAGYKPRQQCRQQSDSGWVEALDAKSTQIVLDRIERMIKIEHED